MNDQTARLKDIGTLNPAAAYSGQVDQMLKDIKEGYKNIVFILPESVMTGDRWRKMPSSETFQANCVGGTFHVKCNQGKVKFGVNVMDFHQNFLLFSAGSVKS